LKNPFSTAEKIGASQVIPMYPTRTWFVSELLADVDPAVDPASDVAAPCRRSHPAARAASEVMTNVTHTQVVAARKVATRPNAAVTDPDVVLIFLRT
jgi:hypothetical protein